MLDCHNVIFCKATEINVVSGNIIIIPCACLVPTVPEEGIGVPVTIVTDICELPCGFWELNQGPWEGFYVSKMSMHF